MFAAIDVLGFVQRGLRGGDRALGTSHLGVEVGNPHEGMRMGRLPAEKCSGRSEVRAGFIELAGADILRGQVDLQRDAARRPWCSASTISAPVLARKSWGVI